MHAPNKPIAVSLLVIAASWSIAAQRPRSAATNTQAKDPAPASSPSPSPAPQSFKAKYEGGVFGYRKKQDGTLSFDDPNGRLVFRDLNQKELFTIPYDTVSQEYADTQANRPKSATILGSVPLIYAPNPIGYIKTKNQYLTLQFYDQNSHVGGVTSFRVENRELCESIVAALAEKAGLVRQGEIYVRMNSSSRAAVAARMDPANRPAVAVENEALSARVISLPRPVTPAEARESKTTGIVRVLVTVDEQGNVVDAEAISGTPILQAAAVEAARQAKFEPVMTNGRPVKTKSVISYTFQGN